MHPQTCSLGSLPHSTCCVYWHGLAENVIFAHLLNLLDHGQTFSAAASRSSQPLKQLHIVRRELREPAFKDTLLTVLLLSPFCLLLVIKEPSSVTYSNTSRSFSLVRYVP